MIWLGIIFLAALWGYLAFALIQTIRHRPSHYVPPSPLIDLAAERERRRRRAMSRAGFIETERHER